MYWLSFADPGKPEGQQFLGAVIAPCDDFIAAVAYAHAHGVNPGGECKGAQFDRPPWLEEDLIGRLLSKTVIEARMGGATVQRGALA